MIKKGVYLAFVSLAFIATSAYADLNEKIGKANVAYVLDCPDKKGLQELYKIIEDGIARGIRNGSSHPDLVRLMEAKPLVREAMLFEIKPPKNIPKDEKEEYYHEIMHMIKMCGEFKIILQHLE